MQYEVGGPRVSVQTAYGVEVEVRMSLGNSLLPTLLLLALVIVSCNQVKEACLTIFSWFTIHSAVNLVGVEV